VASQLARIRNDPLQNGIVRLFAFATRAQDLVQFASAGVSAEKTYGDRPKALVRV